jgi:hypothetical protein
VIYIKKSDGDELASLLEEAKNKDKAEVYRSGPVYEQIKTDFHEKCYLCENNELMSIQIEHFEPHKNDLSRKYDWKNLFYSCGHCNNLKGAEFWPLLNCTDPNDKIWESIEIRFIPFPKTDVEILLTPVCPKKEEGENTRLFLEKALAGKSTTAMKTDQAANLRKKMLRAYNNFSADIEKKDIEAVKIAISEKSPFAGMLRWYLKNDFPDLFNQVMPSNSAIALETASCV